MQRHVSVLLVALTFGIVGCDQSNMVKEKLEADGYSNVQVRKEGEGYTFTADKDAKKCTGTATVQGMSGNHTMKMNTSCVGP